MRNIKRILFCVSIMLNKWLMNDLIHHLLRILKTQNPIWHRFCNKMWKNYSFKVNVQAKKFSFAPNLCRNVLFPNDVDPIYGIKLSNSLFAAHFLESLPLSSLSRIMYQVNCLILSFYLKILCAIRRTGSFIFQNKW